MNWIGVAEDQLTERARGYVDGLASALRVTYGVTDGELTVELTKYGEVLALEVKALGISGAHLGLAVAPVGNKIDMRGKP